MGKHYWGFASFGACVVWPHCDITLSKLKWDEHTSTASVIETICRGGVCEECRRRERCARPCTGYKEKCELSKKRAQVWRRKEKYGSIHGMVKREPQKIVILVFSRVTANNFACVMQLKLFEIDFVGTFVRVIWLFSARRWDVELQSLCFSLGMTFLAGMPSADEKWRRWKQAKENIKN